MKYNLQQHYDWTPLYDYADELLGPHGLRADREIKQVQRGQMEIESEHLPYLGNETRIKRLRAAGLRLYKRQPKDGDQGVFYVILSVPDELVVNLKLLPDVDKDNTIHRRRSGTLWNTRH